MTVFVLMACWDYEGCDLLGVYSSRELAESALEAMDRRVGDEHRIDAREIDSAARWDL